VRIGTRDRRPLIVITNWRDGKHPDAGGAEVVCQRIARSFAEAGLQVVLLTAAVANEPTREQFEGYTIIRRGGRFTVYPWALLWLLLRRNKVAGVIDSQNGIPFFTPVVVRRRTPVLMLIHHVHQDQFGLYFSPIVSVIGRWLERNGSRFVYRTRSIVLVSPSTRNAARLRLGLKGDIVVVPPGSEAVPSSVRGIVGRSATPRIVCVGRLAPHKRTADVVEAMPMLLEKFPDLELHLVGDGPERAAITELVDRLGIENAVVIHGRTSDADRDHLLRTAWMSVNTSEGEGWGLSVIEANAFGVPVLAYRRPGLKDSIRDGETGWLIQEGEPLGPSVAEALRQLHDDREAECMATRTRQWSSQFTWERMARRILTELHAEEGRLAHLTDNRRTFTDLATVVRVPSDLLPTGAVPNFRSTDTCMMADGQFVVLLRGADTETTPNALGRAGFGREVIDDDRVIVSVARPVDLVSPSVSASYELRSTADPDEDALVG
jgi:glycosyltransferase involved in cell wall biosynthesis